MSAYYNEIDPFAAAWLRELIKAGHIADGEVDTRSIDDVRPSDLRGFAQCHFFAGIGGWSLALRMAGWPDSRAVWTGSCPCQRHSSAARGRKVADDLWPAFRSLITANRPRVVFSEQVATAGAWFDGVCDDLEGVDYTIGASVLPACSVGVDHARYRLFFVGYTDSHGESSSAVDGEASGMPWDCSHPGGMVPKDGIPDRVATLRGFGNAIVPAVAAAFIQAYQEARG